MVLRATVMSYLGQAVSVRCLVGSITQAIYWINLCSIAKYHMLVVVLLNGDWTQDCI